MMLKRLAICLLLGAIPDTSTAAGSDLTALRSRGELLGWEAVGRVSLGNGFCTGVLITRDLVLTAAHCVFDRQTGARIATQNIRFQAGYVAGHSLADRRIDRVVVDPAYRPRETGNIGTDMVPNDVALLRLESFISSSEADPFAVYADPEPGEKVTVLSYGRGRSEHPSWQRSCSVLWRQGGLMSFDCDVTFGSSGAPVLVRYGNRVRILSLISATAWTKDGEKVALGMELPAKVAELKRLMRNGALPNVQSGAGAKRIKVGSRTTSGGAKFVTVD
ncbi:trypsin-like serine peptidase [Shimia abyssi]|uniref:Serine protease n=1 Tax=Shimia abyssi TaxID=1662395 RepID=A0A2P8FAA7_9RHOB|nr:trypsin-like serine protease [Shimia abyssi]PSL18653.1 protease YdgD [Shimia abyssi]